MKINIGFNIVQYNDHINLEMHPQANPRYTGNLDEYMNDSVDVINVNNTLDFVDVSQSGNVLKHWCSKIRKNGIIKIAGIEAYEVFRSGIHKEESLEKFNQIIFGFSPVKRASLNSVHELSQLLNSIGFDIIKKGLDGYNFYIEAQKR